ncbi:MAG: YdbH domain-containing protein [Phycisphaeraceae bacterium]|nr:YdbH domain-containing protein [Phycisphaeraceae bacterium]
MSKPRRLHRLQRWIIVLAMIAALVAAFWNLVLPTLLRQIILRQAHAHGVTDLDLQVDRIRPTSLVLSKVTLGAGRWKAGQVVATFDWTHLRQGRLAPVVLRDAACDLSLRRPIGSSLDWFGFPQTQPSSQPAPQPAMDYAALLRAWPVDHVMLEGAHLGGLGPDLDCDINHASLDRLPGGRLTLNAALNLHGSGITVTGHLQPSGPDSSAIRMEASVNVGWMNPVLRVQSRTFTLTGLQGAARITGQIALDSITLDLRGHGSVEKMTSSDGWHVTRLELASGSLPQGVTVQWRRSGEAEQPAGWIIAGVPQLTLAAVECPAMDLRVRGLDAQVPLAWGQAAPVQGGLRVGSLHAMGTDWPVALVPLSMSMSEHQMTLTGQWPSMLGVKLDLQGIAAWNADGPAASLHADMAVDDTQNNPWLSLMLPALKDMTLRGQFAAEMLWKSGQLATTLTARDATIASRQWDAEARGVRGSLALTSLSPLASPGHQAIHVDELRIGRMMLSDGNVQWQLESPRSLFVERMTWGLGEKGKAWVHGFQFDPREPNVDAEIFVEDVPLVIWLGLLTDQQLSGQGALYGRIPLKIRPGSRNVVSFGEGFLASRVGEGWVRVQDQQWVADMVKRAGLGEGTGEYVSVVQRNLIEALCDFEFTLLRFDMEPTKEGLLCRVRTAGRGRQGAKQEIGSLNINIRGLDDLINQSLWIKSGADRAAGHSLQRQITPNPARKDQP